MRAQTCTCAWRVWLDGVTLVEHPLVVELLEEPPESLDILVIVGDIRMIEIYEVTHLLSQLAPLSGELHHVLAALVVVILGRDILLRSLVVDILLGDAEFLLDTEFNRESVGIPSRLAVNLEALHRLVSVESILDTTCQHVVNTRVAIS